MKVLDNGLTPEKTQAYKKEWLNPVEFTEEFGFSIPTQDRMRRERKVPYTKVGRNIRYSRSKINAWLEAHAIVS